MGYPLANLTEMQVIKSKYLSVFDADGCLRADYDAGAAGSMLAALTGLKNLTDDQIRYPEIPEVVSRCMADIAHVAAPEYDDYVNTNIEARRYAESLIKNK